MSQMRRNVRGRRADRRSYPASQQGRHQRRVQPPNAMSGLQLTKGTEMGAAAKCAPRFAGVGRSEPGIAETRLEVMEIARSIVVERQRALETMEKSVETYAGGPHASPVRVVASRLVAGDKREELRALES